MRKVCVSLPKRIFCKEDIAAGTAAGTVHMIMKKSPNIKKKPSAGKTRPTGTEGEQPSFFDAVYEVVRKIPRGRVTTFGAIAEATGTRLSARMVGWAMNAAGSACIPVPAHRVVNRMGMLSGRHHFATPTLMQELLEQEGVEVKDDQVVRFKELFWQPEERKG